MGRPDPGAIQAKVRRLLRPLGARTSPDHPRAVDERHDREARAGMLREPIEVSHYSTVTHLAVSVVLGYIFWGHAPTAYLVTLNVAMCAVVTTTICLTYRLRHHLGTVATEDVVRRGTTLAKLVALAIGLLWSTMPAVLVPSRESSYQLVAVATTAGLISDAYVVGPILAVSSLLVVPIVLGAFVGLHYCEPPFGTYVSLLLVVYALFVMFSTRRMSGLSYQRLLDRVVVQDQSQTIGLLLNEFEESATDWLWETDVAGRLRHVPPRMAAAVGEWAQELRGTVMSDLLSSYACRTEGENGLDEVCSAIERRQPFHDHVVRLAIGQGTRWWRLNGNPSWLPDGSFVGYRGVGSDITRSRESEARISYLASHDALTDLPNRGAFQTAIERACRTAGEREGRTALLLVDLDGFKAINDGHGHTVGDVLLRAVSGRLVALCGERDEAYRLGGDEFAILHRCHDMASVEVLAGRIVTEVRCPYPIDGINVHVGASVGVAQTPVHAEDAATLLSRADLALYGAKAAGKGCWEIFDPRLEQRATRRRRLDAEMRVALDRGELDLHYQPLVDIVTERVVGVEALLRWHTPEEGWIPPAEVIPIAEATGFIVDIGRWALLKACTDVLAWPGLTVAVNISSTHFRSATFCCEVEAVLLETGLDPSRLEIEITESILLEKGPEVTTNMRRLRANRIRLSLDDFGTGYSSLSYLSKFTFDKLKIDRSFVRDLHLRCDTLAIFDAINGMATALGMLVTVEGVEQEQQIQILRQRFRGSIQGYYFSKPKSACQIADEILALHARSGEKRGALAHVPPGGDLRLAVRDALPSSVERQAS